MAEEWTVARSARPVAAASGRYPPAARFDDLGLFGLLLSSLHARHSGAYRALVYPPMHVTSRLAGMRNRVIAAFVRWVVGLSGCPPPCGFRVRSNTESRVGPVKPLETFFFSKPELGSHYSSLLGLAIGGPALRMLRPRLCLVHPHFRRRCDGDDDGLRCHLTSCARDEAIPGGLPSRGGGGSRKSAPAGRRTAKLHPTQSVPSARRLPAQLPPRQPADRSRSAQRPRRRRCRRFRRALF